jgi:hypothetical protein
MHASTHSSNFDENTDSTAMSLTVIAYQWGWNYFFPSDTVAKLRNFNSGGIVQTQQFDQTPESRISGSKHSPLRKISPYYDHSPVKTPSFAGVSYFQTYGHARSTPNLGNINPQHIVKSPNMAEVSRSTASGTPCSGLNQRAFNSHLSSGLSSLIRFEPRT